MKKLKELQSDFKTNYVTYVNNLSRLANMLIISNFSLFFLTELVTLDRYYYFIAIYFFVISIWYWVVTNIR